MRFTTPRRRLMVVIGASLLTLGVVPSCGIASDDQAQFKPEADVPFDLLGTVPPGTDVIPPANTSSRSTICLPGADGRNYSVQRAMPTGYTPLDLIDVVTAGPTKAERAVGLTNSIGEPHTVTTVEVDAGVATVDLDPDIAGRPTADQLKLVMQVVCTLTAQPGIGQVRFTVDHLTIAVPRGDGSTSSDPVSREDYEKQIAPG